MPWVGVEVGNGVRVADGVRIEDEFRVGNMGIESRMVLGLGMGLGFNKEQVLNMAISDLLSYANVPFRACVHWLKTRTLRIMEVGVCSSSHPDYPRLIYC